MAALTRMSAYRGRVGWPAIVAWYSRERDSLVLSSLDRNLENANL